MNSIDSSNLSLSTFDYDLPPEQIARYPLDQRDASRMMHVDRKTGTLQHGSFGDLPLLLNAGDVVVLNNARVIPARLEGTRKGLNGHVELFLLHPQNSSQTEWLVLMRPARRLKPGSQVVLGTGLLEATILERYEGGKGKVSLSWPSTLTFEAMLEQVGTLPLPSYLERPAEASDRDRYQTVFAKVAGAQAAPTAGLHFTPKVLETLKNKGVHVCEVTLSVSAGTFRPVLSDEITDHKMDPEYYSISEETAACIEAAKARGNKVVAIGTTVAKTLETCAFYNEGRVVSESRWSELFITPGFRFNVVDTLLTNFHLPKSTLLMLVSAFASIEQIREAYGEAIAQKYRFYSYGDCMVIT